MTHPSPHRRIATWLMFISAAILASFLSSCQSNIFGLTTSQRFDLYGKAAAATGHPEAGAALEVISYATRKPVTASGKNPSSVQP